MKKLHLDPLQLDKKTIALLDSNQLRDITGGNQGACGSGSSAGPPTFTSNGGSTGCGAGSSQCVVSKSLAP